MNFINFIISSKINFTIDFIVNLIKLINFIINLFQTKFIIKQDFITFKVNFIGDFKINPKSRRSIESEINKDPCKELEILLDFYKKRNLNETDIRIKKLINHKLH